MQTLKPFIIAIFCFLFFIDLPVKGSASEQNSPTINLRKELQWALKKELRWSLAFLSFYEEKILEEGLQTALGLSGDNKEVMTYLQSLHEVTFNTYFMVRLILSKYAHDPFLDELLLDYENTLHLLRARKKSVQTLLNALERTGPATASTPLTPLTAPPEGSLEALSKENSTREILVAEILTEAVDDEFRKTPFFKDLLKNRIDSRIRPLDPNDWLQEVRIDDFNIESTKKFIGQDGRWELLKQLNALNFFLLLRGPALLEKFVRSPLGVRLGHSLRIPGFIKQIGQLKWPMNSLLMWVIIETADGCLIRYSYLAFAFEGENHEDFKAELLNYLEKTGSDR